ncbi:hypothetical protein FDK38_002622 [Candidozyma auris]|nr:hypothetical protein FDK38_002622 [[Candida] auris]
MTQEVSAPQDKPVFGASGRKIIYDKDGKPCRSCNTLLDFQMATGGMKKAPQKAKTEVAAPAASKETEAYAKVDPPDVEKLGRSSWTLLHSIAATYPENPSNKQQADMRQFLKLFGNFYPCWFCAEDFEKYMAKNEPTTDTQDHLGKWLCEAHNDVNKKLGKPEFDCDLWKKRWKDGWE